MISDRELVIRALEGEREAFGELIGRYQRMVHAAAWGILRDHHAAEDVTQGVFLKAFDRLATLQREKTFGAWVLVMARHAALDGIRGRKRLVSVPVVPAGEIMEERSEEDASLLIGALGQLPAQEQQAIFLHYFNDLPVAVIAEVNGCPVGTVTKQLSRGLVRLREILKEPA